MFGFIKDVWWKIQDVLAVQIGKVSWKTSRVMSAEDFDVIRGKLKDNYFIIVTRHNGHLSSHVISLLHFFLTGKYGYYGHVMMNVEDEVGDDGDYRFIESTAEGTHFSGFTRAFDPGVSSVALLKPKSMSITSWTAVLDKAKMQDGKPYDTLFDLSNDQALSCVELIRVALQSEPGYSTNFAEFEKMIAKAKNLDPMFFYECADFEVVWEMRH